MRAARGARAVDGTVTRVPPDPAGSPEELLEVGRAAMRHEASTVEAVARQLDAAFARAVRLIVVSDGRVIVTGLGKSGLVGQKIAATLSSVGSPAHFVHATEALHGDAGAVLPTDVMLALSNSGETAEVLAFARSAAERGTTVVAITGRRDSTLSALARETILVPTEREADPHDLAPTASTTAQMAVGDALSIAVMVSIGFDRASFLSNHPGGSIGRLAVPRDQG